VIRKRNQAPLAASKSDFICQSLGLKLAAVQFSSSGELTTSGAEKAAAWWEAHGKRSKLIVSVDESGVIGWATSWRISCMSVLSTGGVALVVRC
jgi:hypothetical protein